MLRYVTHLRPLVLDLYLYSFDGSLRARFSFLLKQAFTTSSKLHREHSCRATIV
jgi:hypothetical protein